MPKLINAGDLNEKLNEMSGEPDYQHPDEDWRCGLHMAMSAVDEAPAVDAVKVVYCKDCKHFDMQSRKCQNEAVSTDNEGGADYYLNFDLYDYCSFGERR
jgi:hypothetical protein